METNQEIKETTRTSLLSFKITFPIVYLFIAIIDIFVIALIYNVWANLSFVQGVFTGPGAPPSPNPVAVFLVGLLDILMTLWYYLIIYSPIFLLIFVFYELTRYLIFLRFGEQTSERAQEIAAGSTGMYVFRIHYFLTMFTFIAFTEFLQIMSRLPGVSGPPGEEAHLLFSTRFTAIFLIHILSLLLGPHLLKYTADPNNKKLRTKLIVYSIVWPILFVILFLLDGIIIFTILLSGGWPPF